MYQHLQHRNDANKADKQEKQKPTTDSGTREKVILALHIRDRLYPVVGHSAAFISLIVQAIRLLVKDCLAQKCE